MASELIEIKYVGRHSAVVIDPDGFGEVDVVRGATVKVPADEASGYLAQPTNWELAEKATSKNLKSELAHEIAEGDAI